METRIRISTAPPNEYDPVEGDASYYCDVVEIPDWSVFAVVDEQIEHLKAIISMRGLAAYLVHGPRGKEIGVAICYEDDDEGLMYCGVDHAGRVRSEPAINEALWHVANAAASLPNGHRLDRKPNTVWSYRPDS